MPKEKEYIIDTLAIMTGKGFERMDNNFERMDAKFAEMDERFDQIDNRFNLTDKRFDSVDGRLSTLETDMKEVRIHLDRIDTFVTSHERRISRLETKVA
jgi:chromosome segregation ATPase